MKQNVGSLDRIVRVILGVALIGAGVYFQSWWGALAIVPLGTAAVGWCPPYAILGLNTCRANTGLND